jgi:hypothetical protein
MNALVGMHPKMDFGRICKHGCPSEVHPIDEQHRGEQDTDMKAKILRMMVPLRLAMMKNEA